MFFCRWCLYGLLFLAGSVTDSASAQPLTTQEQAWITANPIIPYRFITSWPLEYMSGNEHFGYSRMYLDHLERKTGLRFVVSTPEQQPMMISAVAPALLPAEEKLRWRYTASWSVSSALIVSYPDRIKIRSTEDLKAKNIAVRSGTFWEGWLREQHPEINVIAVANTPDIFETVLNGTAEAGLGEDLVIRPLFNRYYSHRLAIAGQIPELTAGIAIGVDPSYPELLSILNKTLANISAGESHGIFERWVGGIKLGSPSIGVVIFHYYTEMALIAGLVICLVLALRRTVKMKKQAIASELQKTEFLAMMSHEIRTPMNALIASLELLRLPDSNKQQQKYIELAFSSSQSMLALLNDILDHSKLSHRSMMLELSSVSVVDLVDAISENQRPAARQKGLVLETDIDSSLRAVWIETDVLRLRQIINNLLSNAIKFTPAGSVTLSASAEFFRDNTCMLSLAISDTGIGIPPEAQATLFHAWTQVDRSRARRYDGSGLGLYICHELAVLMRGALLCESEPGKGSTFTLRIPVRLCRKTLPPTDVAPDLPRFVTGTSVLVVEDHQWNQLIFTEQLRRLGCEVEIAGDGKSALSLLDDENYYDVILLDCSLPDQDGYSIAEAIRQREYVSGAPPVAIVAISAMNDALHYQRCEASGIDVVLTKPVCLEELASELANWCRVDSTLSTAGPFPVPAETELNSWLLQDLTGFQTAAEHNDRAAMLYHIHRLRGVAAMHRLPELTAIAEQIEGKLRTDLPLPGITSQDWCEQLRSAVTLTTHI